VFRWMMRYDLSFSGGWWVVGLDTREKGKNREEGCKLTDMGAGENREVAHSQLLWQTTGIFVLERVLAGRTTGSDARTAVSDGV